MKTINQISTLCFLIILAACGAAEKQTGKEQVDETQATSIEAVEKVEIPEGHYGKIIDEEGVITMEEFDRLISNSSDTVEVKITSKVNEVCKKKGCWMKIDLADGSLMRVTFKDYGFFVPEEIVNREVILEGKAFRDTTSVADLKHYAEDGGKSEKEIALITTPEIKTTFVAEGVIMK